VSIYWNSPAPLFSPRSVAILGASDRPASWPDVIYRNLTLHGFTGEIYPVNPKYQTLWGKPCYRAVRHIPGEIDQAIVLIPNHAVLSSLREAVEKGCRSAIVISGGFRESGTAEGRALEEELSAFAEKTSIKICGPNCVGLLSISNAYLPTTYGIPKEKPPFAGGLSLVSQSGGFLGNLLQSATDRGIGFRYLVSSGNEAGLDLADYVDYFLDDPATKVVGLFIEGVKHADKFWQACLKARELEKPIVAMKLGRSEKAKRAALSHTGSITGSDEVFDAVFQKLGIVRADDPDELLETAALFLDAPLPKGSGLGVLTNSGGLRGMVCDTAEKFSVELPALSSSTTTALNEFLSVGSAVDNPLDGGWGVLSSLDNFQRSVELLLKDPDIHILALQGKLPEDPNSEAARRYLQAAELARIHRKPVVVFSIFSYSVTEAGRAFKAQCPLPFVHGLDKSFKAIRSFLRYASRLPEDRKGGDTPRASVGEPTCAAAAEKIIAGKKILSEVETEKLLELYGIPCAREKLAASAREAGEIADAIGYPVALKTVSPQILHKTEAGEVRLNLRDRKEVEGGFAELMEKARDTHPEASIMGILVQEMVSEGVEVILGIHPDPQFGPVLAFGLGGIFVELLKDLAYRLPPLDCDEAMAMIRQIKGYPLLAGFRSLPPADLPALAQALVQLSRLALDLKGESFSLDINPLKVLPMGKGIKVIDALAVRAADAFDSSKETLD